MTVEERLRTELHDLAHEAPRVEVWSGVQREMRLRRRRRQAFAAVVTAVVVALAVVGGVQARHPRTQPAHQPGQAVDLRHAPAGTLPRAPLVVGLADGTTYAVAWDGQAVRLPEADRHPWADDPVVSVDGTSATGVVPGTGVVVTHVSGGHQTAVVRGSTDEMWAVLSPDGRQLLELAPVQYETSVVHAVDLGTGRTAWGVPVDVARQGQLRWTPDGGHLGVLYLSVDGRVMGVQSLTGAQVRAHAHDPWQDIRFVSVDASPVLGWALSPDGSRLILGSRTSVGSTRDWYLVSPVTGEEAYTFTRPFADRLLAWTVGDRLVWWRAVPGTDTAAVLTTARDGSDEQTLYRIQLPYHLTAYAGFAAGLD
jgi:hypothetical protein